MLSVYSVEERIAMIRGSLAVANLLRQTSAGDCELGIVSLAVYLGHLERRPMDISAIAAVTQLSRTTITRKLRQNIDWPIAWETSGRRTIPGWPGLTPFGGNFFTTLRAVLLNTNTWLANPPPA